MLTVPQEWLEPAAVHLPWHFFTTDLGWMALAWQDEFPSQLRIGFDTRPAAEFAIKPEKIWRNGQLPPAMRRLLDRLKAYAGGTPDDFLDLALPPTVDTPFQQRVVQHCRRIGWGKTLTYLQLAARAGSPRGARAVGNVMRANPLPLLIPCHRVVGAGGSLGGYSAPTGLTLKRRLLILEGARDVA